jgi:hypothetical protein
MSCGKREEFDMSRAVASLFCLVLAVLALGSGTASADPVQHFDTFTIQCGGDTLVIASKPGSSTVVTVNGMPANSVSILMGITVTVNGVVDFEFHKPFTQHQDVTICTEVDPGAGVTVVAETLLTPRGK